MYFLGSMGINNAVHTTSVDAKHHGASLSERWNVTWVGKQQYMYT